MFALGSAYFINWRQLAAEKAAAVNGRGKEQPLKKQGLEEGKIPPFSQVCAFLDKLTAVALFIIFGLSMSGVISCSLPVKFVLLTGALVQITPYFFAALWKSCSKMQQIAIEGMPKPTGRSTLNNWRLNQP